MYYILHTIYFIHVLFSMVLDLLPQILEWLPESEHEDVRSTWPPMKLPRKPDNEEDDGET